MANAVMTSSVHLQLSKEEAEYLKALTQNYCFGQVDHDGEPDDEKKLRADIFHALKSAMQ